MDERRIKDLLRDNHVYLIDKLDFRDTTLPDVLLAQGLLTRHDVDVIQSKKIRREMSKHFLLSILTSRDTTKAFKQFMYGLMMTQEQEHVAEKLDPILAAEIKEELKRPPKINPVPPGNGKIDLLRRRHLYLIENINMKHSELMDHLLQEGLLSGYENEKLKTLESNDKMVSEYLLFMLPFKGPDHVDKFIKALSGIDDAPLNTVAKTLQDDLEPPVDETDNSASLESIISHLKIKDVSAFSSLKSVTRDIAEKAMKEDAYQMRKRKRGRAVIINNKYFVGEEATRTGADVDLADLKTLFESLYFDVVPYENCTSDAMIKAVDDECEPGKHDNYDAFVMFILTHGTNGYVSASDSKNPVKIDDVVKKIGRCESLKGKPKIFFIQACRVVKGSTPGPSGSDATDANPVDDGMKETKELTNWSPLQNAEQSKQQIADFKDIYIAYSTVPGFYSYRSEETGSWFVRFLIHVISTRAHVDDLESMIKRVNRFLESRPEKSEQIGQTVATGLSRKIYFFPNYSTE